MGNDIISMFISNMTPVSGDRYNYEDNAEFITFLTRLSDRVGNILQLTSASLTTTSDFPDMICLENGFSRTTDGAH